MTTLKSKRKKPTKRKEPTKPTKRVEIPTRDFQPATIEFARRHLGWMAKKITMAQVFTDLCKLVETPKVTVFDFGMANVVLELIGWDDRSTCLLVGQSRSPRVKKLRGTLRKALWDSTGARVLFVRGMLAACDWLADHATQHQRWPKSLPGIRPGYLGRKMESLRCELENLTGAIRAEMKSKLKGRTRGPICVHCDGTGRRPS